MSEPICAVCGASFASFGIRGRHERIHHPDWTMDAELRVARLREARQRWIDRQEPTAYWLGMSNVHAARYGLAPLPLDTALTNGPCAYCGGTATGWDHVVPMSKGGPHEAANLVPCCKSCNTKKQDTDPALLVVPNHVNVRCGWCWTPLVRSRSELLKNGFATCSRSHLNAIRRWGGLAFGDPLFAGPRMKLPEVA